MERKIKIDEKTADALVCAWQKCWHKTDLETYDEYNVVRLWFRSVNAAKTFRQEYEGKFNNMVIKYGCAWFYERKIHPQQKHYNYSICVKINK